MNITVIGATGMVGTRLVTEATTRGHRVIAAARHPGTHPRAGAITSLALDARDPEQLAAALHGTDGAFLAVRPSLGHEHTLAPLTTGVLDAAASVTVEVDEPRCNSEPGGVYHTLSRVRHE